MKHQHGTASHRPTSGTRSRQCPRVPLPLSPVVLSEVTPLPELRVIQPLKARASAAHSTPLQPLQSSCSKHAKDGTKLDTAKRTWPPRLGEPPPLCGWATLTVFTSQAFTREQQGGHCLRGMELGRGELELQVSYPPVLRQRSPRFVSPGPPVN